MKKGIELIAEERQRQIEVEGWTAEHDSQHKNGELANAAVCYAMTPDLENLMCNTWDNNFIIEVFPFKMCWLKRTPNDRVRDLVKAGALIAAEIDRLLGSQHFLQRSRLCVVALSRNLKLTTTLDRAITQNPCYVK